MTLGENLLKQRKKSGLSQETLGEQVGVTRQTISNWELNETAPNPEQLKLLSKALNISIDSLLDNDVSGELIEKVSNTEKLTGIIIKGLKIFGIIFIIYISLFIIGMIGLAIYSMSKGKEEVVQSSATIICSMDKQEYQVEFGTDNYFSCDNCSSKMAKDLKKLVNFENLDNSLNNVEDYFIEHNGTCE